MSDLSGFIQVPQAWLNDERLSLMALGTLTFLTAYGVGSAVMEASLMCVPDDEDEIITALHDLEMHGYVVRQDDGTLVLCDPFAV